MPAAYSNDLREKIVFAYQQGKGSMRKLSDIFDVSVSFIFDTLRRYKMTGKVDPTVRKDTRERKITPEGEAWLKELLYHKNDLTLQEICQEYQQQFSILVGKSTMDRTLRKMGITRKKSPWSIQNRSLRRFKLAENSIRNL